MIYYQLKVHKEDGAYWGEFQDLPGCFTQGDSKEDLLENACEVLSLYLEDARDPKWNIPKARKRAGKQYIWVSPFEDVAIPLMIRQARIKKGLKQRQLANLSGLSLQQIQKLETPGKSNPTVKALSAISRALQEQLEIKLIA